MKSLITSVIYALAFFAMLNLNAQTLQPGDIAPDFTLKNVDGRMVSLSDYEESNGIVLIYTCNHCPYAIAWEDRIISLDEEYKPKGYPVIAINPNDPEIVPKDSYDEMIKRAKEQGFTFPYLFDEGQHVYTKYGATHTPHVFLLQNTPDGFIVRYVGAIDDNYRDAEKVNNKYLEMAINALINETAVFPQHTRALGCTIKDKRTQKK